MASSRHARVARLRPPGRWWYLAVCEDCGWAGMSWKDKGWAEQDAAAHDASRHVPVPVAAGTGAGR